MQCQDTISAKNICLFRFRFGGVMVWERERERGGSYSLYTFSKGYWILIGNQLINFFVHILKSVCTGFNFEHQLFGIVILIIKNSKVNIGGSNSLTYWVLNKTLIWTCDNGNWKCRNHVPGNFSSRVGTNQCFRSVSDMCSDPGDEEVSDFLKVMTLSIKLKRNSRN